MIFIYFTKEFCFRLLSKANDKGYIPFNYHVKFVYSKDQIYVVRIKIPQIKELDSGCVFYNNIFYCFFKYKLKSKYKENA